VGAAFDVTGPCILLVWACMGCVGVCFAEFTTILNLLTARHTFWLLHGEPLQRKCHPVREGMGIHFLCSNTAVPSLCIDFFCVQEAHENSQHTHTHVNILHTQCSLCTAELRHSIECMSIYASVQGVAVWEGTGGGQLLCTTHIAVYPSSAGTACPRWGSVSADKYLIYHLASICALVCNLQ